MSRINSLYKSGIRMYNILFAEQTIFRACAPLVLFDILFLQNEKTTYRNG